ncbi:ABC1 kinase family protein [Kitasatospora sp. NPDC090091]|uniref:ABC1 kinase family protein n=1 Tax=Kitasatospora sp. NPDC090091 TaxID=3364081 RepID=UPI00380D98C2
MSDLPKGSVRRFLKVASLPLGYAGRTAFGVTKRLAGGAEDLIRTEIEERTAKQLFAVIGELKGGAQKFAQVLSVMESALPENLVRPYRAALTSLQEAGPSLPARTVHAVLREHLGDDWRELLTEFADRPVATASIGQVHRGRWHDGRDVAIKVQHPGAADALSSDFDQLTRMGWIIDRVTGGELKVNEVVTELRERMAEELDYLLEADSQAAFAEAFADDPDFFVPRVVKATERVLVTEWMDGTPASAVMADGDQADRDRLGLLLTRFNHAGPNRCGMLHADPHPGNFRLTGDGRLGVLDFGAVARLPDGPVPWMGRMMRACADGDTERMVGVMREVGLLKDRKGDKGDAAGEAEDWGRLHRSLEMLVQPLAEEVFAFDREWMREAVRRATLTKDAEILRDRMETMPEHVLMHRVWMAELAMLSQLGARIPYRAEAIAGMPGFALDPSGSGSPAPRPDGPTP